MSQTLFAIRGKLGTTEYYAVTMKAGELVSRVSIPEDIPEWDNLSIEERYQRKINENRVKKIIAPYLANDNDRFFGALLVTMIGAEDCEFEPLEKLVKGLPLAYKTPAKNAGCLTLSGSEVLVPLDGQHRLRAIKYAIEGKDSNDKDIDGCRANLDLAKEDVVVVLFKFEPKTARKIFTKVNKYAKPTTKAENLITDDDDVVAVIVRKVANNIGARIVNFVSNSLNNKSREFTTLATLYDCTDYILNSLHGKIDKTATETKTEEMYFEDAWGIWKTLTEKINHLSDATSDPEETGDDKRRDLRKETLLAKPIAQSCLVRAFMNLKNDYRSADGAWLKEEDICVALNNINWDMKEKVWQNILMKGGRIAHGKETVHLATEAIIYFSGFPLQEGDEERFLDRYRKNFPQSEQEKVSLPDRSAGQLEPLGQNEKAK